MMTDEYLDRLIQGHLDGNLTGEESADFESLLLCSEAARQRFWELAEVHGLAGQAIDMTWPTPENSKIVACRKEARPKTIIDFLHQRYRVIGLALAAGLLVVSLLQLRSLLTKTSVHSTTRVPEIGTSNGLAKSLSADDLKRVILSQAAGAVFYGDLIPRTGSPLEMDHEYSLWQGEIEIEFPRGARAIFDAPAVFQLKSESQIFVSYGNCSVHAPDGSEGFEVVTPYTQFIDRGTRFLVNVDESGESEVHVVEGLVDAVTRKNQDSTRLFQGEQRRYERTGSPSRLPVNSSPLSYRSNLSDRLMHYRGPLNQQGGVERLESVTVMRGGQLYEYSFPELIGGDVTSFCERGKSPTVNFIMPEGYSGNREDLFLHDDSFQTGIVNPGGSKKPFQGPVITPRETDNRSQWTPGMTVTFRAPVVNSPGPDILLFDAHTMIHPLAGDSFHIRPLELQPGYRAVTITKYDLGMFSPEILPLNSFELLRTRTVVQSRRDLLEAPCRASTIALNYRVVATGIDLSEMGVPPGESVTAVFIQDALDDAHRIDPVMVVGLPEISPP